MTSLAQLVNAKQFILGVTQNDSLIAEQWKTINSTKMEGLAG
jgi:hypothetical protein